MLNIVGAALSLGRATANTGAVGGTGAAEAEAITGGVGAPTTLVMICDTACVWECAAACSA